jgi:hypothetical protein
MVRLLALGRKCNFPRDFADRRRVERCVENPTLKNWNAAYGVVLGSLGNVFITLWQAVLLTDPSFPAPDMVERDKKRIKWTRLPSQDVLVRAVTRATLLQQPPEDEGVDHGH